MAVMMHPMIRVNQNLGNLTAVRTATTVPATLQAPSSRTIFRASGVPFSKAFLIPDSLIFLRMNKRLIE